jgi:UDP-N-acetylglucosamine 2-epimerase
VVGARPQFVKAAAVSRAVQAHNAAGLNPEVREFVVHTGQHFDDCMSGVFFRELGISPPAVNLAVGAGGHGRQTGRMLELLEDVFLREKPAQVVVYGDTNSTLAGVLAAAKLRIPVAHVEAGLRSFNRRMPEEINRIVADSLADVLLCPSHTAVANLRREGASGDVHLVGDVMYDSMVHYLAEAEEASGVLGHLGLRPGEYYLATVHRSENADDPERLARIVAGLEASSLPVILPLHPRTRRTFSGAVSRRLGVVRTIDPVGYLDMLMLERHARAILTDSGGVQKEAYWMGVPCITLREETEWTELVDEGWNWLAGADEERIRAGMAWAESILRGKARRAVYGEGRAAERIVAILSGEGRSRARSS